RGQNEPISSSNGSSTSDKGNKGSTKSSRGDKKELEWEMEEYIVKETFADLFLKQGKIRSVSSEKNSRNLYLSIEETRYRPQNRNNSCINPSIGVPRSWAEPFTIILRYANLRANETPSVIISNKLTPK
ncbi:hypothetical protein HAX54_008326, partial [Datura stramonium]|nr:hypothetical protein [Datura stramonium]